MNRPSKRMLELLSLLQSGRAWPATELAARLDTSPRTLRRDIDQLRELGYPVTSTRGPGGSYQLVAGRVMPPLLLTDDEAVATVIGLRLAALTEGASEHEGAAGAAEGALRKLERVLPSRLRQRMTAMSASIETVSRRTRSFDLRAVRLLGTAAYAHQDVRFDYSSRSGEPSKRRVEPYRQVLFGRRWYLLGWDLDRQDWRTFRLDRISGLRVPGSTFVPRPLPPEGPVSFVHNSARHPITRQHGIVRFAAPLAVVSERLTVKTGLPLHSNSHPPPHQPLIQLLDGLGVLPRLHASTCSLDFTRQPCRAVLGGQQCALTDNSCCFLNLAG
ncbi:MAG: helix-turn-helix transcriptional regulator [Pseudonocardiaceae bacterium]